ncbi:MAG TPA: TonB-dependent receptor [Caulobacteraceae bacterium]|nr:TonB-dependent receptor [Caulobacteraceae bacterium]
MGLTYEPWRQLRVTVDVYEIDLDNRIVKSSPNFSLTAAQVAALGFPGLSAAQFFTNGVDTRTQGIDLVAEYQKSLGEFGTVHWSALYSANGTDITRIKASAANFTPLAQRQLTEQTPRYRLALGPDWDIGPWKIHFLETLYGPYEEPVNNTLDAVFHPKWIADLDVSYAVRRNLILAVGANNLFNAYPSRVPPALLAKTAAVDSVLVNAPGYSRAAYGLPLSGGGIYGSDSPFGLQGGFYYVHRTVKF